MNLGEVETKLQNLINRDTQGTIKSINVH